MPYDYFAAKLQDTSPLLAQLAQCEGNVRRATKAMQKHAEEAVDEKQQELYDLGEPSAIYQYMRATECASGDGFRTTWQQNESSIACLDRLDGNILKFWREVFETPVIDLKRLPAFSFVLQFEFSLAQPLLSKDEQDFYIIYNPIRKDKVFRLPYMAASSWKGCLRAALCQLGFNGETEAIGRLFGNRKGTEAPEEFHAGRLQFFPTFFPTKGLEIINPHNRQRRVGKEPILIESVPRDANGLFTVLYVPFDRVGDASPETRKELSQDLRLLAEGLSGMFLTYGFGAKTSSGFGTAKEKLTGSFQFLHNWKEPIPPTPAVERPGAKRKPKTVGKGLDALRAVSPQPPEDAEAGVGFKELRDHLERVSVELKRQVEQVEAPVGRPPHGQ